MPARAVRYIFDTDSSPDKSLDPIWLLGIHHPGYEPPELSAPSSPKISSRNSASSSSTSSFTDLPDYHQLGANKPGWPPAFYADFTSRIWLTYRSHFPPIRDGRLADLGCAPLPRDLHVDLAAAETGSIRNSPPKSRAWPWSTGAEKGWTTDSGWGCMLRTGQSLLANSLIHLHLSRDWRRPPYPIYTADYATYVQILTWFFDTPAIEAPFSVHRMALAGKELGKDVGQWFGPSTAAGAIKALVHTFPESGLSVAIAIDSALYQSDVYIASHGGTAHARSPRKMVKTTWGDRPVLLLLGVRLGIDRVNPIYYDTIKQLYTFPQSVGIAGGRPGSSYYFVGAQGNSLFYLDPHQSRHAIPLRPPPFSGPSSLNRDAGPIPDSDRELGAKSSNSHSRKPARSPSLRQQPHAASPSSVRTTSSTYSYHTPISPSPLQHQYSTSSSTSNTSDMSSQAGHPRRPASKSSPPVSHARWHSQVEARHDVNDSPNSNGGEGSSSVGESLIGGLDALQQHYATAYSAAELKTFHCEQVRKMPMSGLDPSMLIGFLCRDEAEWVDLKRRVADLPRTIFSIQDEPPSWPSDSDDNMGLESISDPEDVGADGDGDEDNGAGECEDEDEDGVKIRVEGDEDEDEGGQERQDRARARQKAKKRKGNDNNGKNDDNNDDGDDEFYDTRSRSSAEGSRAECGAGGRASTSRSTSRSDTEEDALGPITPGPGSRFTGEDADNENALDDVDVDDDDWVDPSMPSPPPSRRSTEPALLAAPPSSSIVEGAGSGGKKGKGKKKTGPGIVPVIRPHVLARSPSPLSTPGLKSKSKGKTGKSKSSKSRQGGEREREKEQEHYLFPSAGLDDDGDGYGSEDATPLDRSRNNTATATMGVGEDAVMVKRMNTTRARDGGRTQSGGVKGVLTTS
ncbi:hypothetical protein APHAL10511_006684 [Amanita phalloides]|nr:hypothetical protein APHAL10511_006684 [Amanita phalloides]